MDAALDCGLCAVYDDIYEELVYDGTRMHTDFGREVQGEYHRRERRVQTR